MIPNALQAVLDGDKVDQSFMFHLVFKGHLHHMPQLQRPPSLQPMILERIKEKLEAEKLQIHYRCGDLWSIWRDTHTSIEGPVFFSLSDLLSFVDFDYVKKFCQAVETKVNKDSSIVLRAFLRHQLSQGQLNWLKDHFEQVEDLSNEEMTKMYKVYAFGKAHKERQDHSVSAGV